MNQKDNNIKFKKLIDKNNYNNSSNLKKREKIKQKIMNKYGISSEKAEKILLKIEKKETKEFYENNENFFPSENISDRPQISKINMNTNKNMPPQSLDNENHSNKNPKNLNQKPLKIHNQKSNNNTENETKIFNNQNLNDLTQKKNTKINSDEKKSFIIPSEMKNNTIKKQIQNPENNLKNQNETVSSINKKVSEKDKNVDSILEDIIPNYNQQLSIKVNHVDLTFEVQNEKIDTIKEAFIRSIKRDKSKKIKIHALKDVSFQIYKGEKVGIIGYNGAGKSTLLNVITGIYPPDKGSVTTYGHISPLLSLGAGFDHNFSGRRNIMLNGAVLGYDREFLESKMDEIIEFSELGEYIDIPIKNYSSGMLAKLGFSIATSVNPDILIIDEILGVGDVNFVKKSADKIRSLMDGNTTVILVSHSIPQVRELCDKAIWIYEGSVRSIGEVNKVCDEYLKDAEKASNAQLANIKLY